MFSASKSSQETPDHWQADLVVRTPDLQLCEAAEATKSWVALRRLQTKGLNRWRNREIHDFHLRLTAQQAIALSLYLPVQTPMDFDESCLDQLIIPMSLIFDGLLDLTGFDPDINEAH
jgi:hypothetical protein